MSPDGTRRPHAGATGARIYPAGPPRLWGPREQHAWDPGA